MDKNQVVSDQARLTLDQIPKMSDMISMKGKVAVVVGGSYGMGYNLAYRYCEDGARVVIVARGEEKCKQTVADFKECGYEIDYCLADMSKKDDCYAAVEYVENKYGKVDIMAIMAAYQELLAFLDVEEERYDNMIDTNVKGTYFMCQAAARSMIRKGVEGYIVNCSSTASVGADSAMSMMSHYVTSKGAVNALTHALARELAQHNIHVNCVACGNMKTTGQDGNGPRLFADYGMDCVAVFADGGLRFCTGIPTTTISKFVKSLNQE